MLNENQIEAVVEKAMDKLDERLFAGMDQVEYDEEVLCLDIWASEQYAKLKPKVKFDPWWNAV